GVQPEDAVDRAEVDRRGERDGEVAADAAWRIEDVGAGKAGAGLAQVQRAGAADGGVVGAGAGRQVQDAGGGQRGAGGDGHGARRGERLRGDLQVAAVDLDGAGLLERLTRRRGQFAGTRLDHAQRAHRGRAPARALVLGEGVTDGAGEREVAGLV